MRIGLKASPRKNDATDGKHCAAKMARSANVSVLVLYPDRADIRAGFGNALTSPNGHRRDER